MNWDQPSYSFDYGKPPTPIGTPSSTTFGHFNFQTPKPESSFDDPRITWDTANPYATSPSFSEFSSASSFATPRAGSFLDGNKAALIGKDIEAQIAAHVQNLSPNPSPGTGEVEKFGRTPTLASSQHGEGTLVGNNVTSGSAALGLALDTGDSLQSSGSSLQTPPPSSTSASKRKGKQSQDRNSKVQLVNGARRKSVPSRGSANDDTTFVHQETAPKQQSNTLHSNTSDFPMPGPATAPVYPQHKVFWDPSQEGAMNLDFQVDFESASQQALESFVSSHVGTFLEEPVTISSAELHSHPASFSTNVPMSFELTSEFAGDISARGSLIGLGVDPSLIHSSPSRIARDLQANAVQRNKTEEDALQPYAYQLQQLKREQSLKGIGKTRKKQKPTSDSPAVKAALETLREDEVNHRVPRRSRPASSSNRASSVSSRASQKRDVTPWALKAKKADVAAGRSSLKTRNHSFTFKSLHARRTAVSLTIDASGRARTETRPIEEPQPTPTGSEGRSQRSIDDSDSEMTDDDSVIPVDSHHPPNLDAKGFARFSASSTPFSHSHKSSSTSVFTSTSYPEGASENSEWTTATTPPNTHRLVNKRHDISDSVRRPSQLLPTPPQLGLAEDGASDVDAAMDYDNDVGGTAQDELKKVLKSRSANRTSMSTSKKTIRPTPSSQRGRASILPPRRDSGDSCNINGDLALTGLDPQLQGLRCVCNVPSAAGKLVKCGSCQFLLHVDCVISNLKRLPKNYKCIFCAKTTFAAKARKQEMCVA